jgi:hypothetical protein
MESVGICMAGVRPQQAEGDVLQQVGGERLGYEGVGFMYKSSTVLEYLI